MKKTIMSVAVTTALFAGAANAGVEVYGQLGAAFEKESGAEYVLTDKDSFIGVAGGSDSAAGVGVSGVVELNVNVAGGGDAVEARKAAIAVEGEFGKVSVGRQDTVGYGAVYGAVDHFHFDAPSVEADSASRVSDSVVYTAPEMVKGLSLSVGAVVDGSVADETFASYEMGATFEVAEGIKIGVVNAVDNATPDTGSMAFGGSYEKDNLYVAAAYETVEVAAVETSNIAVSGAYTVDATTFGARVMQDQDSEAQIIDLEAKYAFNDAAHAYVGYSMANSEAELAGAADKMVAGFAVKW